MENLTPSCMRTNTGVCKSLSVFPSKGFLTFSTVMKVMFPRKDMFHMVGNFPAKTLLSPFVKGIKSISSGLSAAPRSVIGQVPKPLSMERFLSNILTALVSPYRNQRLSFLIMLRYIVPKHFVSTSWLGKHEDCMSSFCRPIHHIWISLKRSGENSRKSGLILTTIGTKQHSLMRFIAAWITLGRNSASSLARLTKTSYYDVLTTI